ALRLQPEYAEAHNSLGIALLAQGKLDEAVACYQRAIRLQPDYAAAYQNLGTALNSNGELDEALAAFRKAIQLTPDAVHIHSCIVFNLHYHPGYDAGTIFEECRRWNQQHAEPLKSSILPHCNVPDPQRRLRIGYLSPDFRDHVLSYFLVP